MYAIKKYLFAGLITLCCSTVLAITNQTYPANSTPNTPSNTQPSMIPTPPDINAHGYVLMDANSGKIIAEKNMNTVMQPASLTKLMTLYITSKEIASGQIHLQDKVRISNHAWKQGGSRMFLKPGSEVSVRDLISGVIVASGNDACVALAEHIAGDENSFVQIMNATAAKLGMKHTHYVDSNGLPRPGHVTTPYDMALLTRAIIKNYPRDYAWYKQKWIDYNHIKQPNRNRLLWRDTSVDGLKTGHTSEAGYCLISSAKRNGMRLISVVMGTPTDNDRAAFSETLLNWGYHFWKTYYLYAAHQPITKSRVWFGANKEMELGLQTPLYVSMPNGSYSQIKAVTRLPEKIDAPIEKGQQYGSLNIMLHNKIIATRPLIALNSDPKGSLFRRIADKLSQVF
jgi:serine-type D-Ala-D-Ala carboxypeptidase (penicillin-binding protein 5/6)